MCVGCVCVCVHGGDSDINAQRWEIFPNRKVSVEIAKLDVAFVSEIYRILELESYLGATESKIMPSKNCAWHLNWQPLPEASGWYAHCFPGQPTMYSSNFNGYEIAEHILRLSRAQLLLSQGRKNSVRGGVTRKEFISTGLLWEIQEGRQGSVAWRASWATVL